MKKHSSSCVCGDHVWVRLTRGYLTLVSPCDAHFLEASWHAFVNQAGNIYAARRPSPKQALYLHRSILEAEKGLEVDHKNRNGLDNRRPNLRLATKSLNAANRKKVKGIWPLKGVVFAGKNRQLAKPFSSRIKVNCKSTSLGYFRTAEEAAAAYYKAAVKAFGDFARSQ